MFFWGLMNITRFTFCFQNLPSAYKCKKGGSNFAWMVRISDSLPVFFFFVPNSEVLIDTNCSFHFEITSLDEAHGLLVEML